MQKTPEQLRAAMHSLKARQADGQAHFERISGILAGADAALEAEIAHAANSLAIYSTINNERELSRALLLVQTKEKILASAKLQFIDEPLRELETFCSENSVMLTAHAID